MFTKDKVTQMLELMTDIVNDDNASWQWKQNFVKSVAKETECHTTALQEFVSWFPDEAG